MKCYPVTYRDTEQPIKSDESVKRKVSKAHAKSKYTRTETAIMKIDITFTVNAFVLLPCTAWADMHAWNAADC